MLSQIRQISDGNHNTVFVKNKEHKFNLEKEIHDLECWKQSRSHVYRKEERELLHHLEKLKEQQEYLHHLDEERSGHIRSPSSSQTRHSITTPKMMTHDPSQAITAASTAYDHHPDSALPPVKSATDKRAIHRASAHTNICVICQLPRWTYGQQPPVHEVCCCVHQEGISSRGMVSGHENCSSATIQVGQRRHSLMMARLNDNRPHPPDHKNIGEIFQHHNQSNNHEDRVHLHSHLHHHIHVYNDHGHHGLYHLKQLNDPHDHDIHHGNTHRRPIVDERDHDNHSPRGRHRYPGIHSDHHTPRSSPRRHSRQSFAHNDSQSFFHESLHGVYGRRPSNAGSVGLLQDSDARIRDHELHWDRHQVCKLKGMITDPHYKAKLEDDNSRRYPWSGLYPTDNHNSIQDFEELKNCRYLRFSKLNLMSMKENPEEEVDVFSTHC